MKRIHLLVASLGLAAGLAASVYAELLRKDVAVFLFVGAGLVFFMVSWRLEG